MHETTLVLQCFNLLAKEPLTRFRHCKYRLKRMEIWASWFAFIITTAQQREDRMKEITGRALARCFLHSVLAPPRCFYNECKYRRLDRVKVVAWACWYDIAERKQCKRRNTRKRKTQTTAL